MELDFLAALEAKIHEAAARLASMRAENRELARRVAELEDQLDSFDASDRGVEAWQEEKAEIRRRVEALAEHLESMLDDAGADD